MVVYNQASSPSPSGEEDESSSRHAGMASVPVTAHMMHGVTSSHVTTPDGTQYTVAKGGPVAYRVLHHDMSPQQQHHSSSSDLDRSPDPTQPISGHPNLAMAQQLALASGSAQAILAAGASFHASPSVVAPPVGSEGPYFVMMTPTALASEAARKKSTANYCPTDLSMSSNMRNNVNPRDDKRRATHNEVERRRRDKINNWIMRLAKLIPDVDHDHSKSGQVSQTCVQIRVTLTDVFCCKLVLTV